MSDATALDLFAATPDSHTAALIADYREDHDEQVYAAAQAADDMAATAAPEAPADAAPPHEETPAQFNLFGEDLFGEAIKPVVPTLHTEFIIPPFSVMTVMHGPWIERKRAWLSLGIESEVGREGVTLGGKPPQDKDMRVLGERALAEADKYGRAGSAGTLLAGMSQGTISIFDPVLCELAYRWYAPPGGLVLDPFAGGSVRGIVAGMLGYYYLGIDLRQEQVDANMVQAATIAPKITPQWVAGDSHEVLAIPSRAKADLVFTCPPYADLEVYSDDPADLSVIAAANYDAFVSKYTEIIGYACDHLADNRFALCVVGEVRDRKGMYRGFVQDTIAAFRAAGLGYYNEIILATPLGSAALRAGGQFRSGRKVAKVHQNVLVFVKGDPKKATQNIAAAEEAAK